MKLVIKNDSGEYLCGSCWNGCREAATEFTGPDMLPETIPASNYDDSETLELVRFNSNDWEVDARYYPEYDGGTPPDAVAWAVEI